MHKKITITIDEKVYNALYCVIGRGNIGQFLENFGFHVLQKDLVSAYQAMAADEEREREALEWSDGLIES